MPPSAGVVDPHVHTRLVYTTQKESSHRIPWNPWSPLLWCLFPPSRQKRLFEERCKKVHAPRMQVFLQANSSGKPQTAGSGVCLLLLGDTPPPTPISRPHSSCLSSQGDPQGSVCSDSDLLGSTKQETLPSLLQQRLWLIPVLRVSVGMLACV